MRCKDYSVTQIMVGLYRVGIVGLHQALKSADESGLTDREQTVDLIMELLSRDNYFPERQRQPLRVAVLRELLRHRGEEFSEFFSEVEVTIRAEPGEERERFESMTLDVFAEHELRPVIGYAPPGDAGPHPQLAIGDQVVVCGNPGRERFKSAVRKSFSEW